MASKKKAPVRINTQIYGRRVGKVIGNTVRHKDSRGYVHVFDRKTGEQINSFFDNYNHYGAGGGRGSKGGKSTASIE